MKRAAVAALALRAVAVSLALAILAGCATPPPSAAVDERYVLLGPEGRPVVRVITAASTCPTLVVDGSAVALSIRMPPATIAARPARPGGAPSKAAVFDVTTCEATLPVGVATAAIDGVPLPLPKVQPQRIVVLGDTGCAVRSDPERSQACNDPAQWPYARIAAAAAAMHPDLVIHVGDYHYREWPCADGDRGCAGSPWGYGFDAWQADFFAPSRPLLAAAPWIVVRGNHESCARAGQGWWRFLDPRPVDGKRTCNDPADDDVGNFSAPYAVPLGEGGDTQFLVFDSSATVTHAFVPTDLAYREYRAQFELLFAMGTRRPRAFFLAHHPVLGFAANPRDPQHPYPGNAGLQSVLASMYPATLFPPNVAAVIAGHNHLLEVVDFASPHPAQIVAGNGGTRLDAPLPVPFPAAATTAPGAVVAQMLASPRFGFLVLERNGENWALRAVDADGKAFAACTLRGRAVSCSPVVELPPRQ